MTSETLHCTCGREVRIVRLNAKTLALGHTTNPRNQRHAVRLAPAARNGGIPVPSTGQPEASDSEPRRLIGRTVTVDRWPDGGASSDPAPAPPRATLTGVSMPDHSAQRSGQGASAPDRHPSRRTPRLALTAGSVKAAGGET